MKQGYLLKHMNMREFEMEHGLITKVVECNCITMQFRERVKDSRMSMMKKLKSDYYKSYINSLKI
jgi:hypothetical protein